MKRIVIATGNPHKVSELREILLEAGLRGAEFVGLSDVGPTVEPVEHGKTFAENATIKALGYAKQTRLWCLADDSGLEVDALGGKPGVISSHYCTDGRETGLGREERDRRNNERVMKELTDVPIEARAARFVCVMALAQPGCPVPMLLTRGTFEGRIGMSGEVPRGEQGFGYDPLFLVAPEFRQTSSELPRDEKNRLSHRGKAARAMAAQIAQLLAQDPGDIA